VLPSGFIEPCLPTSAPQPPRGEQWLHEIKHDGFRVICRKAGDRVKLFSRPGNDLSKRFPLIVEALSRLRVRAARLALPVRPLAALDQEQEPERACSAAGG